MFEGIRKTYQEYPKPFWTLMGASFVDQLGRFLLFPYFSLYITSKFGVGLTQVGILFAIYSTASMVGAFISGAITDKFGRRSMLLFGLIASATSSVLMGIVNDLEVFFMLAAVVGLLSNSGGPAQQAMIADILPADKLTEGYGLNRVVFNISAAVGPAIGGILASVNFLWLFLFDAATSLITALIVYLVISETKPEADEHVAGQSFKQTIAGYGNVLRDIPFMMYFVFSMLASVVYVQVNSSLPVFLNDQHNISPVAYGSLLSLNAVMVVALQFWITRRLKNRQPMRMMALGTLLYAIGFGMFGLGSVYAYFVFAMIVITIGEMILAPFAQSLVAQVSPADMRGRYMATFSLTWGIAFAIGPLLAGFITEGLGPNWVWFLSFGVGLVSVFGYLWLQTQQSNRLQHADLSSNTE